VDHLPEPLRNKHAFSITPERRRQVADQLFETLVAGHYSFWNHVHPLFIERDLTRHDIRELVRRGLAVTNGNYRAVLKLFGMKDSDYYRFHNFLNSHGCKPDFREFRGGQSEPARRPPAVALKPPADASTESVTRAG
jgi:hypothetical protein